MSTVAFSMTWLIIREQGFLSQDGPRIRPLGPCFGLWVASLARGQQPGCNGSSLSPFVFSPFSSSYPMFPDMTLSTYWGPFCLHSWSQQEDQHRAGYRGWTQDRISTFTLNFLGFVTPSQMLNAILTQLFCVWIICSFHQTSSPGTKIS